MTLRSARKLGLKVNAAATLEKQQTLTPKKLGYTMPGMHLLPCLKTATDSTSQSAMLLAF